MTDFAGLLKGGESGEAAIVPGKPAKSYLLEQITPEGGKAAMPKDAPPLSETEIATIRKWIEQGAKYQKHWSFEPISLMIFSTSSTLRR